VNICCVENEKGNRRMESAIEEKKRKKPAGKTALLAAFFSPLV
jgi:hypothetical protein